MQGIATAVVFGALFVFGEYSMFGPLLYSVTGLDQIELHSIELKMRSL